MPWTDDLKMGERYQEICLELFEHDDAEIMKGNFKPYDLWLELGGEKVTQEVKADRLCLGTNNIAIEFQCSGKPSGISTTTADYWVYFVVGSRDYYLIPTNVITSAISERKWTRKVKGGDGWRAEMYLFPRHIFSTYLDSIPDRIPL
jgi:hypothetical protein